MKKIILLTLILFSAGILFGETAEEVLEKIASTSNDDKWITFVMNMLTGKISVDKCLKAAKNKDIEIETQQLCEAYFYIGESYLIKNDKARAREFFQKCLNTEVMNFI